MVMTNTSLESLMFVGLQLDFLTTIIHAGICVKYGKN